MNILQISLIMSRQLRYIRDVTPEVCSWSVRVLVEAKTGCRQSSRSARKFQRLTLIDETVSKIWNFHKIKWNNCLVIIMVWYVLKKANLNTNFITFFRYKASCKNALMRFNMSLFSNLGNKDYSCTLWWWHQKVWEDT